MIKSELVQRIAEHNPHLYQRDVDNIVNAILDEIVAALARGDRVELRGFGAFSVKHRPARAGRNPRTGEHVPVEQKSVPFFKTGKEMRERLTATRPRMRALRPDPPALELLQGAFQDADGMSGIVCVRVLLIVDRREDRHARKIVTS